MNEAAVASILERRFSTKHSSCGRQALMKADREKIMGHGSGPGEGRCGVLRPTRSVPEVKETLDDRRAY